MTTQTEAPTILERRTRLGISQQALADEAGCTQSSVHKVEHGKPTARAIRRVVLDALHRLEQA